MTIAKYYYGFDNKYGLSCNDKPISNFNITVIEKETRIKPGTKLKQTSYLVRVIYTDGRKPVCKWIKNLKKIKYFEDFEINDSLMSSETRALLLNKMLDEVAKLPEKIIIEIRPGLNFVDGSPVYLLGEHIIQRINIKNTKNLKASIKLTLPPVPSVSTETLQEKGNKYIRLLPGVTEPLFFYSLFAVVKPFVEYLQIHCGFPLALIAPSGQLKTTLARLYGLWVLPTSSLEFPIYTNRRTQSILDWISTMSGLNVLIYDLRKSNNSNDQKRQEAKLDAISRHIDFTFGCANVILTGETMESMGIFSCLDRIFQVCMPVMNAQQVRELQKNVTALGDNLMPQIALQFAQSLMANYDDVLKDIQSFYNRSCHGINGTATYATRSHRHTLFIRLTAFLFGKYFYTNSPDYEKPLEDALEKQSNQQERKLIDIRFLESHHDYIADLYDIINSRHCIKATTDKSIFFSSDDMSLISNGKVYLTSTVLKNAFFSFHRRYIPLKEVVTQLHNEGILEEEPSSKGYQKNLGGRKHYVINMRLLVSYLIRHDYPVSDDMRKRYLL